MNKQLINILEEYFKTKPVDKVWVFGSYSRGEQRPDSDIDILVAITPGSKFSILDHSGMICDLEELLQCPVDLVKEGTLLPFAESSANHDKILVYESNQNHTAYNS